MNKKNKDSITISGNNIPVEHAELELSILSYYPENPRVYNLLDTDNKIPEQEDIEKSLQGMDHVRKLIQSIKSNKGLIDPIIVKKGDYIVLEGNSRLAAYRFLHSKELSKWTRIKCTLLPEDIDDNLIFKLLGEYHIIGKHDWDPFEQAGYLYRRHINQSISVKKLSEELPIARTKIKHYIEAYELMKDYEETDIKKWSFYYEYVRSRIIRNFREEYENVDDFIVDKIQNGEIEKADDLRKRLPKIIESPLSLKKFINGELDYNSAYDHVIATGNDNTTYRKLSDFRQWLNNNITTIRNQKSSKAGNKIGFELSRLDKLVERLCDEYKKIK